MLVVLYNIILVYSRQELVDSFHGVFLVFVVCSFSSRCRRRHDCAATTPQYAAPQNAGVKHFHFHFFFLQNFFRNFLEDGANIVGRTPDDE